MQDIGRSFSGSSLAAAAIVGRILSDFQSKDQITTGKYAVSITPFVQLNWGSNVVSQGYPKMRSLFPRLVIRNLIFSSRFPVWTDKSTYWVSIPAWLLVPSMFQIFRGRSRSRVPRPSRVTSRGSMKLSVAPESTKIHLSVIEQDVQNETGIFILRRHVLYTDRQQIS